MIWAVQMSTVEFHPWNSRRADTEKPDEWRIDLDPGPAVGLRAGAAGRAHVAHEVLDELGAVGFPKTSGGKGLHVYVRIQPEHGFKDVRRAALAFAREVERRAPDDVTTEWWRKDRDPHHLFVDYNQNARDHTIAAAYSVRGVPDARVSAPIRWDEVDDARPARLHDLHDAARFAELGDLHADIDDHVFDIAPLLEWADRDEAEGRSRRRTRGRRDLVDLHEKLSRFSEHWSPRWWRGSTTTRSRSSSSRASSSGTPRRTDELSWGRRRADDPAARRRRHPDRGAAVRRAARRRALPDRRGGGERGAHRAGRRGQHRRRRRRADGDARRHAARLTRRD